MQPFKTDPPRLRQNWMALVQTRPIADDGRMQPFGPVEALFKGRHFDGQIIILCVSWYTNFKLSLRDLVIMMADRGVTLTHTTVLRSVQRYVPEFEKRWSRYARPVGGSERWMETPRLVGQLRHSLCVAPGRRKGHEGQDREIPN